MRANPVAAVLYVAILWPSAVNAAPLQYLTGAGDKAWPVVSLTWGVLLISAIVVIIVALLLLGAIWHRPGLCWSKGARLEVGPEEGGLSWLWIGVGVSTFVLLFSIVWTVEVLAKITAPPSRPPVTIEITAWQWWWQVRYLSSDVSRQFTTANEVHLPVGVPVRLRITGGDVIHSFWIPQLAGKTDAIPGQINETWIEARVAGVYRGQCTEYCGLQHAKMGLLAIAQSPRDFQKWWAGQLATPQPVSGRALSGEAEFQMHCGNCHTVRGTEAAGVVGPDLSHLMQRATIGAATLPNDAADLARWIADPQSIKPGNLMPTPAASPAELADIHAYLQTLE